MAHKAYVLIDVEKGSADTVAAELMHKSGVLAVEPVFGQYDVVALIEAKDFDDLADVVRNVIAQADHVVRTETLVVSGVKHKRRN